MRAEYVVLRLRNKLGIPFKPEKELAKLSISSGQTVLDYGCGIGSFTLPLAQVVGTGGKVFALDREPSALNVVSKVAQRKGMTNIEPILSDCDTHLPDGSVDLVLFIGVLPHLKDANPVLAELHRVLKPGGVLATRYCFRVSREEVLRIIHGTGMYELRAERGSMLSFESVQKSRLPRRAPRSSLGKEHGDDEHERFDENGRFCARTVLCLKRKPHRPNRCSEQLGHRTATSARCPVGQLVGHWC
jgi:SAM-dependent methyltransferase